MLSVPQSYDFLGKKQKNRRSFLALCTISANFAPMNIEPVAFFHGLLTSKFGIPRQSGVAPELRGHIIFTPEFRHEEAIRGLEYFDYLWLIWEFSANSPLTPHPSPLTVRPPRLGGNERVGVFASRSPFRPNRLGLSCVRLDRVELSSTEGPVIHVLGADLMDGTPIFDVKPYIAYADAHADARSGFVDTTAWQPLHVEVSEALVRQFSADELAALRQVLAQDPRPRYHDDPTRVYGMPFAGRDVKFRVADGIVYVIEI
jgi:tRNA-Thr(GGU) m(6)t(6)A37 methyltransferase TsaA